MAQTIQKQHVFSHLGPAPYQYLGVTENWFTPEGCPEARKPGGSCDHCGTGILFEFRFRASNGREFKVGSSCVNKSGDKGLKAVIANDVRDHQRQLRQARVQKTRDEAVALVAAHWPTVRASLVSRPHPHPYFASQGLTYADYCEFGGVLSQAGAIRAALANIVTPAPCVNVESDHNPLAADAEQAEAAHEDDEAVSHAR